LERTLHLAGQNITTTNVKRIEQKLEETYHTDEYFLDEIEHILAPYWEDLTDEEIARLLIESFEVFDIEENGLIDKQYLIENLTALGEMPLSKNDFKIMFSMIDDSKKFPYRQFVNKLCGLVSKTPNKKKKKRQRKKNTKG
jgi:Ca2+-binding EF-hand superfamily protein